VAPIRGGGLGCLQAIAAPLVRGNSPELLNVLALVAGRVPQAKGPRLRQLLRTEIILRERAYKKKKRKKKKEKKRKRKREKDSWQGKDEGKRPPTQAHEAKAKATLDIGRGVRFGDLRPKQMRQP
jgi:hypothetical protein